MQDEEPPQKPDDTEDAPAAPDNAKTAPPPVQKPFRKTRFIILNAIMLIMLGIVGYVLTSYMDSSSLPPGPIPAASKGPVTPFFFTDINGHPHDLKDFTGKIVLINFWATWCPPCLEELPKLLDLAGNNRDKIIIIALSADIEEEHIRAFMRRQEIPPANFIIAWDKDDIAHNLFGISKLPETIIADPALNERTRLIGATWTPSQVQQIIDTLQQS